MGCMRRGRKKLAASSKHGRCETFYSKILLLSESLGGMGPVTGRENTTLEAAAKHRQVRPLSGGSAKIYTTTDKSKTICIL